MAARRPAAGRRRRRRAVAVLLLVAVVLVVALGVRSGRLHIPRLGGASGAGGGSATSGGGITVTGAERLWHDGPVVLRFRDAAGKPISAGWRLDGGEWQEGLRVHVRGPADHSGDGMHVVDVRPVGGGDVATTVKVGIDTRPPKVTGVAVSPQRVDGTGTVKLTFTAPPEDGVSVSWAVVDVLARPVGAKGKPSPPSGAATVDWQVPSANGEKLGPGTYWLRVRAEDEAGNVAEERAAIACVRAVEARVITSLPEAGREVALTFDGGSGYAWRSLMNDLYSRDSLGSFFCTGVSVDNYQPMAQLAVEQGQTIGNHSYDHPDFSRISHAEALRQLEKNTEAWWNACEAVPQPFFRPPYGSYTDDTVKAAGEAGYRYVVMWTGDAGDWTGLPASQVAANALAAAKPGAIIVFHTQWNTHEAMPLVLKGLKKKGYKAVSLAQLCADAGLPY